MPGRDSDYPTIINKVYRAAALPIVSLASICPFISEQIAEGEKHENGTDELNEAMALYRMILESFNQFYAKNLTPYIKYVKASTEDISQLEPGIEGMAFIFGRRNPDAWFCRKHCPLLSSLL